MAIPSSTTDFIGRERELEELLGAPSDVALRNAITDSWSALKPHWSSAEFFEATNTISKHRGMLESHRQDMGLSRGNPSHLLSAFVESIDQQDSLATAYLSRAEHFVDQFTFKQALQAADFAQSIQLPSVLETFRPSRDIMASHLLRAKSARWLSDPSYLSNFGSASAFSRLLISSPSVTEEVLLGSRAFLAGDLSPFSSLHEYRRFLDEAGLKLRRWPRVRPRTTQEKRRLFHARLRANQPAQHIRRAKTLVHQHELTLRQIVDDAMSEAYGDNWHEERLAACGCSDLLGKWRKRGGSPLDHADYHHYRLIMVDPDHYSLIFAQAFSDAAELAALIDRAGKLRAASHHARDFSMDDLRELRVTWLTLNKGLACLVAEFEFEY